MAMTFDLRKFERVWEKAGERPEGLRWHVGSIFEHDRAKRDDNGYQILDNYFVEIIVRDWAVWWLAGRITAKAEHDCLRLWKFVDRIEDHGPFALDFGDKPTHNFDATDPTEVLYLACCSVLDIDP